MNSASEDSEDVSDLSEESAVELNNVWTVTTPHHHIEIHQQLLLLLLIHSGANPLEDRRHKNTPFTLLTKPVIGPCRLITVSAFSQTVPDFIVIYFQVLLCKCHSAVTFTAMIWPVGLWTILLTEPYAPRPISPRSLRSSAVKSQSCPGEIFSFPDDSILCVRRRSLEEDAEDGATQRRER